MSATEDLPPAAQVVSLPLRREALLPNERGRGLGTVAVVCTMAGVASGLALATTLMAMQVADSMSTRTCPYQVEVMPMAPDTGHGFLGVTYTFADGGALVSNVMVGSPAETIGIHAGDKLLAVDGARLTSSEDFAHRIASQPPGSTPSIVVLHDGATSTVRPVLTIHPLTIRY